MLRIHNWLRFSCAVAYGQRYGIQLTRKNELFDFLRVEVCEAAAAARAKAPVLTDGRILGIQPTLAATIRAASGDHLREIRGDTTALSMKSAVATRRLTPTDVTSADTSRHQPTSTGNRTTETQAARVGTSTARCQDARAALETLETTDPSPVSVDLTIDRQTVDGNAASHMPSSTKHRTTRRSSTMRQGSRRGSHNRRHSQACRRIRSRTSNSSSSRRCSISSSSRFRCRCSTPCSRICGKACR